MVLTKEVMSLQVVTAFSATLIEDEWKVKKIGVHDTLHIKLWGIYLCSNMTWMERIPQLIVESDSKILINMVIDNCKFSGTIPILVQSIQNFLVLDWCVQFYYIWREDSRCWLDC
jgi:hypothetical protein